MKEETKEEEISYTQNEEELLELLDFMIGLIKPKLSIWKKVRTQKKEALAQFITLKEATIQNAKARQKAFDEIDRDINFSKNEYHEVTCTTCKFYTALLPAGEMKNKLGYNCNKFICPKCKTEFTDEMPVLEKDIIKYAEQMIKICKKSGMPADQIKDIVHKNEDLRDAIIKSEEEREKIFEFYAGLDELNLKIIEDLSKFKKAILPGKELRENH